MGLIDTLPRILDPVPGGRQLVNLIDYVVLWARANSLWPLTYGTSCCAIEMMASSMPRYDISRFGSEVFRASPRQADLIILAGTIVDKMVEPLVTLYQQLPGPKYVMAMGACTISGGPFYYDNYSVVKGADRIIPVDVFVPGCPPRPETLLHGLMTLQDKIRKESIRNPWKPGELNNSPVRNLHKAAADAWAELERIKDEQMADTRRAFKEKFPDYKPQKSARVVKPVFPEVPRRPLAVTGLPNRELVAVILNAFPGLTFTDLPVTTAGSIDAKPADFLLELNVPVESYREIVCFLKNDRTLSFNFLYDLTAVDWPDRYDLVVQLKSLPSGHRIQLRVALAKDSTAAAPTAGSPIQTDASAPSLAEVYPSAIWAEREVFDLFGIRFDGHPDLRRMFLDDQFVGHPLRKNYPPPETMIARPY